MSLVAGGDHRGAGPAGASHVCMDFFASMEEGTARFAARSIKVLPREVL